MLAWREVWLHKLPVPDSETLIHLTWFKKTQKYHQQVFGIYKIVINESMAKQICSNIIQNNKQVMRQLVNTLWDKTVDIKR